MEEVKKESRFKRITQRKKRDKSKVVTLTKGKQVRKTDNPIMIKTLEKQGYKKTVSATGTQAN